MDWVVSLALLMNALTTAFVSWRLDRLRSEMMKNMAGIAMMNAHHLMHDHDSGEEYICPRCDLKVTFAKISEVSKNGV